MNDKLAALGQAMRAYLEKLPRAMVQDEVIRQSLVCFLSQRLEEMNLVPVPHWQPPRSTRDRIDLVGVAPGSDPPRLEMAFVVDPLVELPKIKALEWVEAPHKVVVSFSRRADKVAQSAFFLNKEHIHLKIYA